MAVIVIAAGGLLTGCSLIARECDVEGALSMIFGSLVILGCGVWMLLHG
jgi:hypothetical protein